MTKSKAQAWWWSLAVAGVALGCGDSAGTGGTADSGMAALDAGMAEDAGAADAGPADTGPADTGASDTGPMLGEYPEGPYGNRRGNILANLSWEGYVNPTGEGLSNEQPYGPTSMQALRAGGRYALVHVSEFF